MRTLHVICSIVQLWTTVVDDLYLPTHKRPVVCMSRKLMHIYNWAWLRCVVTMANKNVLFVMLVGHATRFEAQWGQFSPNLTDLLCYWVAKVPRCQDLATFFLLTMTMTDPITLPLGHARGIRISRQGDTKAQKKPTNYRPNRVYSGLPELRTPWDHVKLSAIGRCPLYRECTR